jgi:transcriptional regulator with XRE-family HTH domain
MDDQDYVDEASKTVGARLKQIRMTMRPRVSRRILSLRCGLSASTIRALEEGERPFTFRTLQILLRSLECGLVLALSGTEARLMTGPLDSTP